MASPQSRLKRRMSQDQPTPKKEAQKETTDVITVDLVQDDPGKKAKRRQQEARPVPFAPVPPVPLVPPVPPVPLVPPLPAESDVEAVEQAKALLYNKGYEIKERLCSTTMRQRCKAFHKLVHWALATVPPVVYELRGALAVLARQLRGALVELEGEKGLQVVQFQVRYEDLLKQGLRRRAQRPEEVQMSELSHHLLLSYLGRPETIILLEPFFESVRVLRGEVTGSSVFHAAAEKEKRKSKPLPSPAAIVEKQSRTDLLHREPAIVSLLIAADHAHAAAISEDEQVCAAGCDRDVRIFRTDGARLHLLPPEARLEGQRLGSHGGRVLCTAFSSELLLTGGQDRCMQLWNVTSRKACAIYRQDEPVWCVDWAPQGHYFVSAQGGEALLWSVQHRRALRIMGSSAAEVQALRVLPDGRKVAVAHGDSLVLWDLRAASPVKRFRFAAGGAAVTALACAEDLLATGFEDGQLGLVDLRRGERLLRGHGQAVAALDFGRVAQQDVLFSAAGCYVHMRPVGADGFDVTEIKVGMNNVLCTLARPGYTLVMGTR